ncbi:uncharacterized protein LOC135960875 [Calliphora vicina]|uniref:uncharacterized protein LOC135960875 n=1 Tax=Calliphora vicina TaxID=7373 RepID=UPI00325BD747
MPKLTICIFLATILIKIKAQKLYGEDFEDATDILNNALAQLRRRDGPYLTVKGIEAAFKFVPSVVYTFDAHMLDPNGKLDMCITELSLARLEPRNSLIKITCDGEEKVSHILKGSIDD